MARFGGMARYSKLAVLFIVALMFLTGCSADILRPDLFNDSDMRAFPAWVDPDDEDYDGGESKVRQGAEVSVWPTGSGTASGSTRPSGGHSGSNSSNPGFTYTPPSTTLVADNFATTKVDTLQCSDYWDYLSSTVVVELQEALDGLSDDVKRDIYLRVAHTGYDIEGDLSNKGRIIRRNGQATTLYGDNINSANVVGGDVLMPFANDWVGGLEGNRDYVQLQIESAQREIANVAKDSDWSQKWVGLGSSAIPQVYKNMMGRDTSTKTWTLQQYYDAIASDPYHNIPNFRLQMRVGDTGFEPMVFNATSSSQLEPFKSGVSLDTVNKIFRSQNQYNDRDREVVDKTATGNSSMIKYHLDGYNKTVIFLGCTDGKNLQDLLGRETYTKVLDIISDSYNCAEVDKVKSIQGFSDCVPIPAGTKGVD